MFRSPRSFIAALVFAVLIMLVIAIFVFLKRAYMSP